MAPYLAGHDAFMPASLRAQYEEGIRPSYERLLPLLDADDPAWPSIAAMLREMADADIELNESTVEIAIKLGAQRFADREKGTPPSAASGRRTLECGSPIVYYIRRGTLIKIGTTVDAAQRFNDLLPDEIFAVEPGGSAEEHARHRQFDHLRCQGEHFLMAPELMAHIGRVREKYGAPDPAWMTSAAATAPSGVPPQPPKTAELMSAAEAVTQLGIPYSTLRVWVSRGRLRRAGRVGNKYFYYADQLRELQDRRKRAA